MILNDKHSHPPPVFYVNDKGEYVRVPDKRLKKMNLIEAEDLEQIEQIVSMSEGYLESDKDDEGL